MSLGAQPAPAQEGTVKKILINKDAARDESDFEQRLRAEAIAAEARQNEAVQHYDASRVYFAGGNTEMAELELQAAGLLQQFEALYQTKEGKRWAEDKNLATSSGVVAQCLAELQPRRYSSAAEAPTCAGSDGLL